MVAEQPTVGEVEIRARELEPRVRFVRERFPDDAAVVGWADEVERVLARYRNASELSHADLRAANETARKQVSRLTDIAAGRGSEAVGGGQVANVDLGCIGSCGDDFGRDVNGGDPDWPPELLEIYLAIVTAKLLACVLACLAESPVILH
jgi:hypothetical protein